MLSSTQNNIGENMKFPRPKKLVFCNNKGGVGKTTLAFHCAVEFAKKGYKTALVDLDPQCNLTLLALGEEFYEETLLSQIETEKTVFDVLQKKIQGSGDIDVSVPLKHVRENLFILPGDIKLSLFENLLIGGYTEATAGNLRGYSDTSAIDRYLNHVGSTQGIDIFIIDTSPSLGVLNRIIFLGTDYFVVPVTPDSFSVQGIKNLGTVFEEWKKLWNVTAKAVSVSGSTPSDHVLRGDALFIGYVINAFNIYRKQVVQRQRDWTEKIPAEVKRFLSEKHGRNGLVEKSWRAPLGQTQDYGQLTAISMENNLGIQEFAQGDLSVPELNLKGTKELQEKATEEIRVLAENILGVLAAY